MGYPELTEDIVQPHLFHKARGYKVPFARAYLKMYWWPSESTNIQSRWYACNNIRPYSPANLPDHLGLGGRERAVTEKEK